MFTFALFFVTLLTTLADNTVITYIAYIDKYDGTVYNRTADYANEVAEELKKHGLRVEVDNRNETIGYKIREATLEKVPYQLVVGDKELEEKTVSVSSRKEGKLGAMSISDIIAKLVEEDKTKKV